MAPSVASGCGSFHAFALAGSAIGATSTEVGGPASTASESPSSFRRVCATVA
jgi:hypothetical protein